MRLDPLVQRRHANTHPFGTLLRNTLPGNGQPAGQRDPHRILADFVRPFQSPLGIMLRITLPRGA